MKQEVKNTLYITVVVLLVIVIVYFLTAVFLTGEIGGKTTNNSGNSINSDYTTYNNMILASDTFNQKELEYMVMFVVKSDLKDDLENAIGSYSMTDDKLKLYVVNVDDVVNKYVYSKDNNSTASNYEELKINKNTLLVIKNGAITSYIVDKDKIIEKLNN